jgi:hypothetical protein
VSSHSFRQEFLRSSRSWRWPHIMHCLHAVWSRFVSFPLKSPRICEAIFILIARNRFMKATGLMLSHKPITMILRSWDISCYHARMLWKQFYSVTDHWQSPHIGTNWLLLLSMQITVAA